MKKFVIILGFFSLYVIFSWIFPYSSILIQHVKYTSAEKHVEEYTQLYNSMDGLSSNGIFQSIVSNITQNWALESGTVKISEKDLYVIKDHLNIAAQQLEYLKKDNQESEIIINIQENLEVLESKIEKVTSNGISSRSDIESLIYNIRNSTYQALLNLKEYVLDNKL